MSRPLGILGASTVAVLGAAVAASLIYLNYGGPSDKADDESVFAVAVAENYRAIDLSSVDCLSTKRDRATIFDQDYSDNAVILRLIEEQFPSKRIASNNDDCPFGIGFTIMKVPTRAVKYYGQSAEILMSFAICTRREGGRFNANECLSKNGYLFTKNIGPTQAFAIGLQALVREQESQWVIMELTASPKVQ